MLDDRHQSVHIYDETKIVIIAERVEATALELIDALISRLERDG